MDKQTWWSSGVPAALGAALLLNAEGVFTAVLAWVAFRENFDRRIALGIALIAAGAVVLSWPGELSFAGMWPAMAVGFLAYGVSLALFVLGLRHLGTARTGAYFSVAPFFGAALALLGGEPLTTGLLIAGVLMGAGVWLHLTEKHAHAHAHDALEHAHLHAHDAHHQHVHADGQVVAGKHTHPHRHDPLTHAHAHYPDAHHRHSH